MERLCTKLNYQLIYFLCLGRTAITCKRDGEKLTQLDVIIIRKPRIIDSIFTVSVVVLVSLVAINFGCTMDWSKPKEILKKPVGPLIGFCGQFIFMPLVRLKKIQLGQYLMNSHIINL